MTQNSMVRPITERAFHQVQAADQRESSREENRCSEACRTAGVVSIVAVSVFAAVMCFAFAPVALAFVFTVAIIGVAIGIGYGVNSYVTGVHFVGGGPAWVPGWRRRPVAVMHTPVYHVPVGRPVLHAPVVLPAARPVFHARAAFPARITPAAPFAGRAVHAGVAHGFSPHRIRQ